MKWFALLVILLLAMPISVSATAISITIYGTNASNAQSNITKYGANNSVNISAWNIDNGIKTFRVNSLNASGDVITFNISNVTAYRVVELRVNSTAIQAYQATANGMVNFTYSASQGNKTYDVRPAANAGGYNQTWVQFWTWPSLLGLNFTSYFLPYSGATADLDMNNKNITNVRIINSTTVNVTILNATDVKGNGTGLYSLNLSNGTFDVNSKVSIGTTSAANPLSVYRSGDSWQNVATFWDDSATGIPYIAIADRASPTDLNTAATLGYDIANHNLILSQAGLGSNVFVINNLGNVGIGTLNPSGKLNVVGNTNISGYLTVADNITRVVNITANYTIGTTNATKTMFTCYADSGTLNLTLPAGVSGKEFTIKKKDSTSNICEIYSNQNIDGALRANITVQYNSIDLVYTDEWSIV